MAFNVTRDTKVQSLQYRIIHRTYPCNYWLSKWNHDISNKCSFCEDIEYLEHHFLECSTLSAFWNGIKNWWHVNLGCTFNLNAKDVIFGICNAYDNAIFEYINYFILMAKYYIMKCRKRELQIEVQDFIHYMKYKLEIEILHYSIAGMKEIELIKWKHLYNLL